MPGEPGGVGGEHSPASSAPSLGGPCQQVMWESEPWAWREGERGEGEVGKEKWARVFPSLHCVGIFAHGVALPRKVGLGCPLLGSPLSTPGPLKTLPPS